MTENNNAQTMSLEDITRALTDLAQHVEAIRGGEGEPELDPSDPLNAIVGNLRERFSSVSPTARLRVDSYLAEKGKPATLRNVLTAYASLHPAKRWVVYRGSADGKLYGIYRVLECRTEAPAGNTFSPLRRTTAFPLPQNKRVSELVGWIFREDEWEHKILETYEADGNTYIIASVDEK